MPTEEQQNAPVAHEETNAGVPTPGAVAAEAPGAQGKLFVGQVPAVCTEDMLRPVFAPYGEIVEIKIMRDAPGGRSKGCAWVKYTTREQAQAAIEALHEQHTIPPQTNTLQVRFADDKSRTSGSTTAFIGNLPPNTLPETLKEYIATILPPTVDVKDVNVPTGKLFGFITFETAQDCSSAVAHMQNQSPNLQGNQLRVQAARPRTTAGTGNMAAAMAAYYASFGRGGGMPMMDPNAAAAFATMAMRGGYGGYGFPPTYGMGYGGGAGFQQQQQQQQGYGMSPSAGGGNGRGRGRGGGYQTFGGGAGAQPWNQPPPPPQGR